MRERTIHTLIALFMISAARASDLATTFHFNPTLSQEANPIVAVFGAGAPGLLLSNLLGVILFALIPLFIYWRYSAAPMAEPAPATARDFMCRQLYGRPLEKREFWQAVLLGKPFPNNPLQLLRLAGPVVTWAIVAASFHAAFSWWVLHEFHWESYRQLRGLTAVGNYSLLEVSSGIVAMVVAAICYSRREFSSYLRQREVQ